MQVAQRYSGLAQLHGKSSLGLVPEFLGLAVEEGQSSPGPCFTYPSQTAEQMTYPEFVLGLLQPAPRPHSDTAQEMSRKVRMCIAKQNWEHKATDQHGVGSKNSVPSYSLMTRVRGPEHKVI